VSEEKEKPGFDDQPLATLLEAAFVLQEHNRGLQKAEPAVVNQLGTQQVEVKQVEVKAEQPAAKEPLASTSPHPELRIQEAEPLAPQPTIVKSPAQDPPVKEVALDEFLPEPAPPVSSETTAPKEDYAFTLAQIVGTQDQIRLRHLGLDEAIPLVAERVIEIAKAGGAAIAMLDGANVLYRSVAGAMGLPAGTQMPIDKALCVASLRAGQVIRCSNLNAEFLLDVEECQRRGIQAMIAVPIFHKGGIAGGLELYYATTRTFSNQDVHTCQLMAGLVTEALAREEELSWKKSVASERAVMLEALEHLKPKLTALVEAPPVKISPAKTTAPVPVAAAAVVLCRKCGHPLMKEEQFCGTCGSPRTTGNRSTYEAPSMQSKIASLMHVQQTAKQSATAASVNGGVTHHEIPPIPDAILPEKPLADSIEEEMPELFAALELRVAKMPAPGALEEHASEAVNEITAPELAGIDIANPEIARPEILVPLEAADEDDELEAGDAEGPPPGTALTKPQPAANWSSATNARAFLEQLAGKKNPGSLARFWKARRGDIYLAVAVVLVAAVIRWGIWSNHSVSATGSPATTAASHRKPSPDADLSVFDRLLISLGLAEAPPAPEYKGNPDTQVWVDLHTALYYCPGADLYGKTPKGRFTSQREAQLDQFEPAYRKTCD
jgi:GAF domain-containing protein